MMLIAVQQAGELIVVFGVGAAILGIVAHLIMGIAVAGDAQGRLARTEPLALMGSTSWLQVTLATGVVGLALYWAMHYSILRREVGSEA